MNNNQLTIVCCLPGKNFSGNFLICWTNFLSHCFKKGYKILLSQKYTSNVYFVRSMCLGANDRAGENQKPFDGKIDYNFILWIDSDIIFNNNQFEKLLNHNVDIVSGIYLMDGGKNFACVKEFNVDYYMKNGYFQYLNPDDISKSPRLMEVSYNGMGFMLIKKGVFESLKYPWFDQQVIKIGNSKSLTSEDVSFCLKAKKAGFKVNIDPTVWVNHEKNVLI